ncbi:SDR family NAD(P)-dependent oxidoreductase [Halioglobus maricola]|uniref:SDR family NAD(P)-dependent oxidoreductase n=1 Tax=Halioglobus maricola TaxID=2601894 RepID=A0A5P9NHZ9_9GAMM|nr:SDR family NAD(P)-dependent oxidoreductase [Halioglobus maricola]QFU75440.1 SDR family NAD(P)-dependent oxidoreductase [Halioglobus maricola]
MQKKILITGATDGIGLETAKMLASKGHQILIHGRNPVKLAQAAEAVSQLSDLPVPSYLADLSDLAQVEALASEVASDHQTLDVLLNNAGIFRTPEPVLPSGMDVRFVVNTLAPLLLARRLMPLLGQDGRIVNLSSAAQAPVDLNALQGKVQISDHFNAYAQSKLALTMWSRKMGLKDGPVIVSVNPGSMLASKMVKEGFGVAGNDLSIGASILSRACLDEEFAAASGQYFDNDAGKFASPHADALNDATVEQVCGVIDSLLPA